LNPPRSRARSVVSLVGLVGGGVLVGGGAAVTYQGMHWPQTDVGAIVSGVMTLAGLGIALVGVLLVVIGTVLRLTGGGPPGRP
jgi:hypothetical protein